MFILYCFLPLYLMFAWLVAVNISEMNHMKHVRPSEWLIGLFWLPILLMFVVAHYWYKVRK